MNLKCNQWNYGQFACSGTAQQVLPGREFRQNCLLKNMDATIIVYVGKDNTVTTSTGMPIEGKESFIVENLQPVWVIAASGTPTLAFSEDYNA